MSTSSNGFRGPAVRLGDLMKMRSVDSTGQRLDHVKDVRLEHRDGGWVVTHIVVGRAAVAERLGFLHGVVERPVLLARLMRRIARHSRIVPWDKVALTKEGIVEVTVPWDELPQPEAYR